MEDPASDEHLGHTDSDHDGSVASMVTMSCESTCARAYSVYAVYH